MTVISICALFLLTAAATGHPLDKDPKWVAQQTDTSQVADKFPSRHGGLGTGGGVGGYHGVFRPHDHTASGHRSFRDDSQVKVDVDDIPRSPVDGFDNQDKNDNFDLKPQVDGGADSFKPIVEDHSDLPSQVKPQVPVYRSERPVVRPDQRPGAGNIKPIYYDPKDLSVELEYAPKDEDKPKIEIALVDEQPEVSPSQGGFGYVEQGKVPDSPVDGDGNNENGKADSARGDGAFNANDQLPVRPDVTPVQQDKDIDSYLPNKPYDSDSEQPRPIQPSETLDGEPSKPYDSENSEPVGPFEPNQQTDSDIPGESRPYQPNEPQDSKDFIQPNPQFDSKDNVPVGSSETNIPYDSPDQSQPGQQEDSKDIEQTRPLEPFQPYDTKDQVKPIDTGDQYPQGPSTTNTGFDVQVQSKDDYIPDQEKPAEEVPEKAFPLPGDNQPIVPEEPVGPGGNLYPEQPFGPSGDGVENRPLIPQGPKPVDEQTPSTTIYPAMRDLCQNLDLKRFMTLIDRADMSDIFSCKGPITIFAPSDQAFSRLPVHVYYRLTRDNVFLKQVLQYHIIEGMHPIRGDELDGKSEGVGYYQTQAPTLKLFFNNYGQNFYVNGLPVSKASQRASNGMIHVLDNVLYPVPTKTIPETLQSTPTFTRFHALAVEAGLFDNELEATKGAHTIFVPSDQAFAKLPRRTMEWLSFDKEALKALLLKHIVPGAHFSSWVNDAGISYNTMNPDVTIEIKHAKDHYTANGVRIGNHDIVTQNGVIHSVNEVLFSKDLQPKVDYKRPTLKRIYPMSTSH